jgi:hypothetical protein
LSYPSTLLAIDNRSLSCSSVVPTFSLKYLYPASSVSFNSLSIFSLPYPNHPALVVYAGTARFSTASAILSSFPAPALLSISTASSGVNASWMYRQSISRTISSGVISATTRHTGLPSTLAQRSQSELTTAPSARCTTPFSGPIQRSCESATRCRQVAPQLETRDSSDLPWMRAPRSLIAAQTSSLPRPMVKVCLHCELDHCAFRDDLPCRDQSALCR